MKGEEENFKCVNCNSEKVAKGSVLSQPDYFNSGAYFRPKELKPFALIGINISFKNRFFVCLDCGSVWSKISTEKLKTVVIKKGNNSVKKRLGLIDAGVEEEDEGNNEADKAV